MKLTLSQIKDITSGAVGIEEKTDGVHFYRFTQQQEQLYKTRSADFYKKTFATSGIQLRFCTNSQTLFLETEVFSGSSRTYFAFDVFVNGKKVDSLDNFTGVALPQDYTTVQLPFGKFSKEFYLGAGDKEVCIYFPWSVQAILKQLSIDDGAYIKANKPSKKMLCFGDSITHGYDALYPSNKYITQLANLLDAQEYNKAIGGEIFFPALAAAKETFVPDYITVAYGTNDWNSCTREVFTQNCREFLANLCANYPDSKIFVITPIWRAQMNESRPFGAFEGVAEVLEKEGAAFGNISVINGFSFVPQEAALFADLRLHPNDEGFRHYFENLSKHVNLRK